jgi:manganese-dependent inorganic pyrophosphatase
MKKQIFVIGHRNPDADAICSAIGYAAFKNATSSGEQTYVAARCGNSNARIDAILGRFRQSLPRFIGDVTPRVSDVMVTNVIKVRKDSICMEALELMDTHDVRVLPVVDAEDKLHGSVSIFALGEYFVPKPKKERQMRHVVTSISHIVKALGAKVVHQIEPDTIQDLFVRIGAMDIRSFGRYYRDDSELASSSVIIVGDRYDIQQRSIQSGVRLLVISGGLPIDEDVIEVARDKGVSIIVSPHDSATTSWIIRSAGQIDRMMNTETLNLRPEEKLSSVARKVAASNQQASMVLDDGGRLVGVLSKTDLLKPVATRLILVDHNELTQAVPGADQVEIVEIVDHHRLGNQPTQQPIAFINLPLGSTSTIVADLYRRAGLQPEPAIAGVLMGGLISDTLNLKGPTTTDTDRDILTWLAELAGCSVNELATDIFNAGSVIKSESVEHVLQTDMKIYEEEEHRFAVSQIEELGFDPVWERCSELNDALQQLCTREGLLFAALLVTDINTQNSILLIRGEESIVESVTYPHIAAHDVFELNGIVSRKKQLIPYLTTLVQNHAPQPGALR